MDNQFSQTKLTFLYVNIGRGHPFYLDGIIEALIRRGGIGLVRQQQDVFEFARGLSALAWRTTRWLYRTAPSHPVIGRLYHALRHNNNYNDNGITLSLLGRDIRRQFAGMTEPLIVSHPTLVGILKGRPGLIYQHGELAAPFESLAKGAELVFVPTSEQADRFLRAGYSQEQVAVTGLCIELALVKQAADCYQSRLSRLNSSASLTGLYFSSGAEPKPHVEAIVQAAISANERGHRAVIFAPRGGRMAQSALKNCSQAGLLVNRIDSSSVDIPSSFNILLVEHCSRREETALSARLFPLGDFLVSPAHERTNWAIGLGLPMYVLAPCFGPFAPLNRQILLDHNVAVDLASESMVRTFGEYVDAMRMSGQLTEMAEHGWGRYPFNGFENIAALLESRFTS